MPPRVTPDVARRAPAGFTIVELIVTVAVVALLIALLEMGVIVGLTATLLYAFRHTGRLAQTLTALMGSGAVIGAIVLVLFVAFAQLPALPRLGVFLWNLLVMGHILRHALSTHLVAGFFIAVGYAVVLRQLILFADRLLSAAI